MSARRARPNSIGSNHSNPVAVTPAAPRSILAFARICLAAALPAAAKMFSDEPRVSVHARLDAVPCSPDSALISAPKTARLHHVVWHLGMKDEGAVAPRLAIALPHEDQDHGIEPLHCGCSLQHGSPPR